MIKRVLHLAIAVENLEGAAGFYRNVLGVSLSGVEVIASQKTKAAFFELNGCSIELVQPTEASSPLTRFLETRGPGIHHVCFEVDDIEAEVKRLVGRGVKMVDEEPRPGAHGSRVAFIHPRSTGGALIELCELAERE